MIVLVAPERRRTLRPASVCDELARCSPHGCPTVEALQPMAARMARTSCCQVTIGLIERGGATRPVVADAVRHASRCREGNGHHGGFPLSQDELLISPVHIKPAFRDQLRPNYSPFYLTMGSSVLYEPFKCRVSVT